MSKPRRHMPNHGQQSGAAILTAMLTVTLVATFAAAALWQQWRSAEIEAAERSRMQAAWVLTGASDWARLILKEDLRTGSADYLSEPWAVPLQEARLSTFLAAEGASDPGATTETSFLSGQITDQQALLNVNILVQSGSISTPGLRSFTRLFELLGLPPSELSALATNLRFANDISADNLSASQAPLMPQRLDQLVWLGLSPSTVSVLKPYITLLPPNNTTVNLNTASAEVIYAAIDGVTMAEAQQMVTQRQRSHFATLADALRLVPLRATVQAAAGVGVASSYFEVIGRVRLDQLVVEERSLVQRVSGTEVNVLRREGGAVNAAASPMQR